MTTGRAVLVVAKAPVPGLAKTRLAADVGDEAAADIAAAALLDTLDAVAAARVRGPRRRDDRRPATAPVGAMRSARASPTSPSSSSAATTSPSGWSTPTPTPRRRQAGCPVLQIGMDTPQVTGELLGECARRSWRADAVLGHGRDGGWWVLGVSDAAMADCLRDVPMSTADTGAVTLAALARHWC